MQAAEFSRDRLRTVLPCLQQRRQQVLAEEELARWLPQYEAAKAQRDALAEKLREVYVPFINEFLTLGLEIENADAEVRRVNAAKPDEGASGKLLVSVEEHARGRRHTNRLGSRSHSDGKGRRPYPRGAPAWRRYAVP
jgi:hypothetical protein